MAGKRAKAACRSVFRHGVKPDKDEFARLAAALAKRRRTAAFMPAPRKGGA